jgi:two-component system response regulator NreC
VGDAQIDRRNITVVLADDHAVFRGVLRLLVDAEPEMQVLAEAADVADAERLTLVHRPRVLVLDLNMPGGSSMEAIPRLREQSPDTAIVVLTMHDDPGYAEYALQAGALGFVLKEEAEDELLLAIRLAAVGKTYLNPRLAHASPPGGGRSETTGPS